MEPLESRRLLSAGASLSNGVLTVTGADNVDDVVTLSASGGMFTAVVDGTTFTFTDPVNSISVSLLSGNDSLDLYAGVPGGSADLGEGNDRMSIGSGTVTGNMVITGGNGNDQVSVWDSPLTAIFDGGAGTDSFTYTGSDTGTTIDIHGSELSDSGHGGVHHFFNIESLLVNAHGGDDVINVDGISVRTTISGGDGNDLFQVASDVNNIGTIQQSVSLTGDAGTDALQIWDTSGATTPQDYVISADTASRTGSGTLTYATVESFALHAQPTSDQIGLISTTAGVSYTIDPGTGSNTITIGAGYLSTCAASAISITGISGTDAIVVDDSAENFSEGYTVTHDSITRSTFSVTFGGMNSVTLDASNGANAIALQSQTNSATTTINGDGGADALTIAGAADSPLVFNGGLDPNVVDTLNVNAGTYTFASDAADGTANLQVNVGASGSAVFSASQHLAGLAITGSATMVQGGNLFINMGSLSISDGGFLAPADNDLIVRGGSEGTWNGSTYTGILGLVQSGRSGGSGIRTQPGTRTLGVASAGEALSISGSQTASFDGETVSPSDVLVKFTYGGDANLDGRVNIDDYGRIDGQVGQSGLVFGWYNGDFNYDGKINIDDYGIIDSIIGKQGAPMSMNSPVSTFFRRS